MRRVLVTGGRRYTDYWEVYARLDEQLRKDAEMVLVQGGAAGADSYARAWAKDRFGVEVETFAANWQKDKHAAGPLRNQRMVDAGADLCIAFPGGNGTADCVRRARKAGIPVIEVK